MMTVVYAKEESFTADLDSKKLFLCGPTPRFEGVQSWRPEALKILESLGFDGVVFVPEPRTGRWEGDYCYEDQIEWEEKNIGRSDAILFWLPRNMENMPALTTNDEWGVWRTKAPQKVVFGCPPEAERVKYQIYYAKKIGLDPQSTLEGTIKEALKKFK